MTVMKRMTNISSILVLSAHALGTTALFTESISLVRCKSYSRGCPALRAGGGPSPFSVGKYLLHGMLDPVAPASAPVAHTNKLAQAVLDLVGRVRGAWGAVSHWAAEEQLTAQAAIPALLHDPRSLLCLGLSVLYLDKARYARQMADQCRSMNSSYEAAGAAQEDIAPLLQEIRRLEGETELRRQQLNDLNGTLASLVVSISNGSAIDESLLLRSLQAERARMGQQLEDARAALADRDRDLAALQEKLAAGAAAQGNPAVITPSLATQPGWRPTSSSKKGQRVGRAALLRLPSPLQAMRSAGEAGVRSLSPAQRRRLSKPELYEALRQLKPSTKVSPRWTKSQLQEALTQSLQETASQE